MQLLRDAIAEAVVMSIKGGDTNKAEAKKLQIQSNENVLRTRGIFKPRGIELKQHRDNKPMLPDPVQ